MQLNHGQADTVINWAGGLHHAKTNQVGAGTVFVTAVPRPASIRLPAVPRDDVMPQSERPRPVLLACSALALPPTLAPRPRGSAASAASCCMRARSLAHTHAHCLYARTQTHTPAGRGVLLRQRHRARDPRTPQVRTCAPARDGRGTRPLPHPPTHPTSHPTHHSKNTRPHLPGTTSACST